MLKSLTRQTQLIIITVVLTLLAVFIVPKILKEPEEEPEVITESSLQEIINISELSTFEAVYTGVAEVMNEENPDKTDYYVYYESKIKAGINFEAVLVSVNHETKKITVSLPEVEINDIIVDLTSLDYIFENDKADTENVSATAYSACIADVERESSVENAIYELAEQNAKNIITALVTPFVTQLDEAYTLDVI